MRRLLAAAMALALIAGTVLPAQAADPSITTPAGQAHALQLLNTPCLPMPLTIAQAPAASPSPGEDDDDDEGASPSPSPSPAPSLTPGAGLPRPIIPSGPGVLVPPPLPSSSPRVTPPPPFRAPRPRQRSRADRSTSRRRRRCRRRRRRPRRRRPPVPIVAGVRATPTPTPAPSPGETLGPSDYAILGDTLIGNRTPGQPFDLDGHVNIIYQDGILVGDHAHYDGTRYIDILRATPTSRSHAGDSTLTADSIRFDTLTQHSELINGRGVTTQGVDRGRLHFNAQQYGNAAPMASRTEPTHRSRPARTRTADTTSKRKRSTSRPATKRSRAASRSSSGRWRCSFCP